MPKGKRPARASWLFRDKPAVASANDTFGRFNVSIKYDESKAEGSVVVHHAVHVQGFQSEQTLDLVLRPESIIACDLLLDNQNNRLPPEVLNLIPTNRSDTWSLSLTLHTPGNVICPTAPLPLSFISTSFGQQFAAFSHLCRTTKLQIYLGKDQLSAEQRVRLENFASAIALRKLRANPIDLRSLGGGGGKQETTWYNIHPPPSEEQADSGATRKRCRVDSDDQQYSGEPSTKLQKFWATVPPGSPTEVNTPSTRNLTPPLDDPLTETPAANTADANTPHARRTLLFASPTPEKVHRSALPSSTTKARHNQETRLGSRASTPLPPYPQKSDSISVPSPVLHKSSVSPWGHSLDIKPTFLSPRREPGSGACSGPSPELAQALGGMLEQMLPKIIEGAFSSILGPLIDARLEALVNHKMEVLVREQLPRLTSQALQQNMARFVDELEDGHKRAEVEIGETVDEARTELNEARDRGIDDIETWAQERFEGFEGEVEDITIAAVEALEDKTTVLKERLDRQFQGQCRQMRKVHGSSRRRSI